MLLSTDQQRQPAWVHDPHECVCVKACERYAAPDCRAPPLPPGHRHFLCSMRSPPWIFLRRHLFFNKKAPGHSPLAHNRMHLLLLRPQVFLLSSPPPRVPPRSLACPRVVPRAPVCSHVPPRAPACPLRAFHVGLLGWLVGLVWFGFIWLVGWLLRLLVG